MKKIFVLLMIMTIILSGCSSGRRTSKVTESSEKDDVKTTISQDKENTSETISADESEPEQEFEEVVEEVVEEETNSTIRPDVKEAIDAYEDFVDEYIEFMKKYEDSNGTDLTLLVDYTKFISNLEEYTDKMEALEKDMTDAEVAYYLEVMNRCNEKMIKSLD